jgi:protein-L-isoaspartate(D-aspartate) O-methyltransferase
MPPNDSLDSQIPLTVSCVSEFPHIWAYDVTGWPSEPATDDRARLGAFLLGLRARGIHDTRVLAAIEQTPRDLFVPASEKAHAFEDRPLPIECGQKTMAPSLIAIMLQAADLAHDHRVLDIGTGSGYTAAIASRLAGQVLTVDRYKTLTDLARDRFAALRRINIIADCRDGSDGWPEQGPFDRIIVSAAAPDIPSALVRALKPGGILIAPIGPAGESQSVIKLTAPRVPGLMPLIDQLTEARFVPLAKGRAGNL